MNSSNNKDLLKNDTVEDKSINEVSNVKPIELTPLWTAPLRVDK